MFATLAATSNGYGRPEIAGDGRVGGLGRLLSDAQLNKQITLGLLGGWLIPERVPFAGLAGNDSWLVCCWCQVILSAGQ